MSDAEIKVWLQEWLALKQPQMVELLNQLVSIESFSRDPFGIRRVAEHVQAFLDQQGIAAKLLEECDSLAVKATVGNTAMASIFLTGHLDTVFKTGTVAKRPFFIEGDKAFGPGVADMKSGIVMNAFVLTAFHELYKRLDGGLPFGVTLFATTDEEIGSPNGRHLIERHITDAIAVFNSEPGRISGNLVSARKGGGKLPNRCDWSRSTCGSEPRRWH